MYNQVQTWTMKIVYLPEQKGSTDFLVEIRPDMETSKTHNQKASRVGDR
jgi:hypothetical protein